MEESRTVHALDEGKRALPFRHGHALKVESRPRIAAPVVRRQVEVQRAVHIGRIDVLAANEVLAADFNLSSRAPDFDDFNLGAGLGFPEADVKRNSILETPTYSRV